MWRASGWPCPGGGLGPPEISAAASAWPKLLAAALTEAIARHLGAELAALATDRLVCWPPCELSSDALATVHEAATAAARERGPVVLDTHSPPTIVAAPLQAGSAAPSPLGSLVVVTSASGTRGMVRWVERLAGQAAAALENARLFDLGQPPHRHGHRELHDRVSVVVVDRHRIVREGLRSVLETEGASVVGEAGSAAMAHEVVRRSQPDVLLLDLELSEAGPREGLELCARISEQFPAVGVVVLVAFPNQALVLDALRRGARGCVEKDVDVAALAGVIRAVRSGESGFDSRTASAVVRSLTADVDARRPALSARELEVIRLVARGRTNRQIGQACFISESTVKYHVRHVMAKLDARHRTEVVYVAGRLGLI
jgi:DNA-binding NarL/FixJ family response regulator